MGLALVAAGCTFGGGGNPPPPAIPASPPPAATEKAPAQAGLGLVPLPSPQQVSAAVVLGRLDPFNSPVPPPSPEAASQGAGSSSAAAAAGSPAAAAAPGRGTVAAVKAAPPAFPADFQFSGVITSRGQAEALVQTGRHSGSVAVGDVGRGSANPWLPKGWSVAAIDPRQGVLTLQQGSSTRRFKLL